MEAGRPEAGDAEAEGPDGDVLLRRLRDSRHRFQRRMQQLIEKYSQPFEDDPLVQMATLTYETPQGLRIWGGKLIKERKKKPIQDSPVEVIGQVEGLAQAGSADSKRAPCRPPVPRTDSEGSDEASSSDLEDPFACALMPAVPGSPLKDELRRKYLMQADLLLRGPEGPQSADRGKDVLVSLLPSLALPAAPALEHLQRGPAVSPRDPAQPASSPGSDSISLLGTSSQSLEADDICNLTISDLYTGMLHSMSRLLSARPGSLISTRTAVVHSWKRFPRWSRVAVRETGCRSDRRCQRSPRERAAPGPEPRRDSGVLRHCENSTLRARHTTGLKPKSTSLEGNKQQVCRFDPAHKELQEPSLTGPDLSAVHGRLGGREDRLRGLMWLISPGKVVSRPRLLQGRENRCRAIEIQFNKLHRECLPCPRKQLFSPGPPGSWAVEVYRGGSESPWASETRMRSLPSSQAGAKGSRSAGAEGHPSQSPDGSRWTADLGPRASSRTLSEAAAPLPASALPGMGQQGGRSRYREIKEEFDKLHQKCCQASPPQAKGPPGTGEPLGDTGAEGQRHTGARGTPSIGSRFPSLQTLKVLPPRRLAAAAGPASAPTACASPELTPVPTKRRRFSCPQADPRGSPGKRAEPSRCPWEKSTSLQTEEKSGFY